MATVKDFRDAIFGKLTEKTSLSLSGFPNIRVHLTEEEHDALATDVHVLSTYVFNRQLCFALIEDGGIPYFLTIGIDKELIAAELIACDNQKTLSMAAIAKTQTERLVNVTESDLEN